MNMVTNYEMDENIEIPMPCMQVGKEHGKLLKEIMINLMQSNYEKTDFFSFNFFYFLHSGLYIYM